MTKEQERLSPEAIANKRRYNLEYRKRNYKNFTVGLTIEEAEEAEKILSENNITKIEFVRLALNLLKNGKISKED